MFFGAHCPRKSIDYRNVDLPNCIERSLHWLLRSYRCELWGCHFFLFSWMAPLAGTG